MFKKDVKKDEMALFQFKKAEVIGKNITEYDSTEYITLRRDLNKLVKIYRKKTHLQTKIKKINKLKIKKSKYVSSENLKKLHDFIKDCIQDFQLTSNEEQ